MARTYGDWSAFVEVTTLSQITGDTEVFLEPVIMSMVGTTTIVGTLNIQLDNIIMYFTGYPGEEGSGFIARLRTLLGCGT
jgi:hypothetical protein